MPNNISPTTDWKVPRDKILQLFGQPNMPVDCISLLGDLETWEQGNGRIPDGSAILVNSGWSDKYGSYEYTGIVRDENNTITGSHLNIRVILICIGNSHRCI